MNLIILFGLMLAQRHTLTLYDAGQRAILTCEIDEQERVSNCTLQDGATVTDLAQRMLEQMDAQRYATYRLAGRKM